MNTSLSFCQPKSGVYLGQTSVTSMDIVLSKFLNLLGTKGENGNIEMAKSYSVFGNMWACDSFKTNDGVMHFKTPIEVTIEPVDGYYKASFDMLGISVFESSLDDLKEYFIEALMCDYLAFTSSENDKLTEKAITYKKWFLENVV